MAELIQRDVVTSNNQFMRKTYNVYAGLVLNSFIGIERSSMIVLLKL